MRDEAGKFVSFTPDFDRLWRWKDELPAERLACAGRHACRPVALVAPALVAALYALTGRAGRPDDFRDLDDLSPVERDVAEVVLECGPCGRPELGRLLGSAEKKRVGAAVEALERRLVLTYAGAVQQRHGWPAVGLDLLPRRWAERLAVLPAAEEARETLAGAVLGAAGEVSAADLAAALRWRRREAAATLDAIAERGLATAREEDGIRLWAPR